MRHHITIRMPGKPTGRATLLATAAMLALGMSGAAMAQGSRSAQQHPQGQQAQATQSQGTQSQGMQNAGGELRTLEQSLRQAHQQLTQNQGGGAPNWDQIRSTVNNAEQMFMRMPANVKDEQDFKSAQREMNDLKKELQDRSPDRQAVATQINKVADAIDEMQRGMGGSSAAMQGGTQQGTATAQAGATGARIAVQQPAPNVSVAQPAPNVTVTQPAPDVVVKQPQPNVTVQQAQPNVTVQQPEPKVTVQQAQPKVTVQQAQPNVSVQQAKPDVTVQQQGKPNVTVQRQGTADVTVQRQGQAQVQTTTPPPATGAATTPPAAGSAAVTPAVPPVTAKPGGAVADIGLPLQQVSDLIGTNVVGANGKDAGEIENLLVDSSGRVRAAVIQWGGFLGIGEKRALVPIERVIIGTAGTNARPRLEMTRQELEALPRYDRDRVESYARDYGWGGGARLVR